jgi:hypothetical protein
MQHKSAKAAKVSESSTCQLNAAQVGEGSSMQHKSVKAAQRSTSQRK